MSKGKSIEKRKTEREKNKHVLLEHEIQNEEKFLEELIRCVLIKLKSGRYKVKIADAIRAIELKEKIRSKEQKKSKEKIFWGLIDQIRKEELPKE